LDCGRTEAEHALRALRCSNHEVRWVAELVDRWTLLGGELREALATAAPPGDVTLRRWAARAGRTRVRDLLRLAAARFAAERVLGAEAPAPDRARSVYRRLVPIAYRDPIALSDLAVSGTELVRAGVPAGPEVGIILQRLLDLVVEEPGANLRERLLAQAREWVRGSAAGPGGAAFTV
jgi:hypothetical protein